MILRSAIVVIISALLSGCTTIEEDAKEPGPTQRPGCYLERDGVLVCPIRDDLGMKKEKRKHINLCVK